MIFEYTTNGLVTYTSLLSFFTSIIILAVINLFKHITINHISIYSSYKIEFIFISLMSYGDIIASIGHGPIMAILNATNEQQYACTVQGVMQQFGESLSIYARISLAIVCNQQYYHRLAAHKMQPTFCRILSLAVLSAALPFVGTGYDSTNFEWCWISADEDGLLGHIWRMCLLYIPTMIAVLVPLPQKFKSKPFGIYMRLIQYSMLVYIPPLIIRVSEIQPLSLPFIDTFFQQNFDFLISMSTLLIASIGWLNALLFYFLFVQNIGNLTVVIDTEPADVQKPAGAVTVTVAEEEVIEVVCVETCNAADAAHLFDIKCALLCMLSDDIPRTIIDAIHQYLFTDTDTLTMNVVSKCLSTHFGKEEIAVFVDFCTEQEYKCSNIYEDLEDYDESAIADHMNENITNWTEKDCLLFTQTLRDICCRIPDIIPVGNDELFYENELVQQILDIDRERVEKLQLDVKYFRNNCDFYRVLQREYDIELNLNDITTLMLCKDILKYFEQNKDNECSYVMDEIVNNYLNVLILKCYPMFVDIVTNENSEYSTIYHEAYYLFIEEENNKKLSIFNEISLWVGCGKYQALTSCRAIMEYKHFWSHFKCGLVIGIPIDWGNDIFDEWVLLPFNDKVQVRFNNFQIINISLKT